MRQSRPKSPGLVTHRDSVESSHSPQNIRCRPKILGTEENPSHDDGEECHGARKTLARQRRRFRAGTDGYPSMIYEQIYSMQSTPGHERPVRAMPQAP